MQAEMQSQMQAMMSNPAQLQAMMSNPMVQQMFSDPAQLQAMMSNPMVQQMMAGNPEMAERLRMPVGAKRCRTPTIKNSNKICWQKRRESKNHEQKLLPQKSRFQCFPHLKSTKKS